MNLRNLTDDQLHISALNSARREREETLNVLHHLSEIERRHLFSKYSFDSLYAYCVGYLEMSEGQAGRHVSASRLLREMPVIEEKIREGTMNFSSVCQASSFFKREASVGHRFAREEKLELLSQIENQSVRKIDQILLSHSVKPEVHIRETVKQKTETLTEIKITVDAETLADLDRLKEIWSHAMPGATYSQIIKRAARLAKERHDPDAKAIRAESKSKLSPKPPSTPTSERERARYIPAHTKRAVWIRDQGRCTFKDPRTREMCGAKAFIEYDHIEPFAHGGTNAPANLRLRCRAHNQRHAIETLGFRFMGTPRRLSYGRLATDEHEGRQPKRGPPANAW